MKISEIISWEADPTIPKHHVKLVVEKDSSEEDERIDLPSRLRRIAGSFQALEATPKDCNLLVPIKKARAAIKTLHRYEIPLAETVIVDEILSEYTA